MRTQRIMSVALLVAAFAWSLQARAADEPPFISLQTERKAVYLGEPLLIWITVTNRSPKPIAIPVTWEAGYFRLEVTRNGKTRQENPFLLPATIPVHKALDLATGQSYSRSVDLLRVLTQQESGRYSLRGMLESSGTVPFLDRETGKMRERECWAGKILSKPLEIQVKPLEEDADVAALKTLCLIPSHFQNGYFTSIWDVGLPSADLAKEDDRFIVVLRKYPKSIFARHCEYALATRYATGYAEYGARFDETLKHYTNVVKKYPDSHFADDAELDLAKLQLMRHQRDPKRGHETKAIEHLRNVLKEYPQSDSVAEARRLLATLKEKQAATAPAKPKTSDQETHRPQNVRER